MLLDFGDLWHVNIIDNLRELTYNSRDNEWKGKVVDIKKLLDELTQRGVISGIEFDQGTKTRHVDDANDTYWFLRNHAPIADSEVSLAVAEALAEHFGIRVAYFRTPSGPHGYEKVPYFAAESHYGEADEEAVLKACRGITRARDNFQDVRNAALEELARLGIRKVFRTTVHQE